MVMTSSVKCCRLRKLTVLGEGSGFAIDTLTVKVFSKVKVIASVVEVSLRAIQYNLPVCLVVLVFDCSCVANWNFHSAEIGSVCVVRQGECRGS
jgi:hypothetical protein